MYIFQGVLWEDFFWMRILCCGDVLENKMTLAMEKNNSDTIKM